VCCATGQARRLQPAAPTVSRGMHSGVPACLDHRDFAGLPALAALWPPAATIIEAGCCFQALLTTATGLPPDQQVLQLRTKLGDWLGGSVFDKAQQLWQACGQPFEVVERVWDPGGLSAQAQCVCQPQFVGHPVHIFPAYSHAHRRQFVGHPVLPCAYPPSMLKNAAFFAVVMMPCRPVC
jgi:hypothetical protein